MQSAFLFEGFGATEVHNKINLQSRTIAQQDKRDLRNRMTPHITTIKKWEISFSREV